MTSGSGKSTSDLDETAESGPSLVPEGSARARTGKSVAAVLAERFGLVGIIALAIVAFSVDESATFPTAANLQAVLLSISVLGVVAMALMIPMVGGRFDVSVGGNLGLCVIVIGTAMARFHLALPIAIVLGIVAGTIVGVVNGVIVAYLGVNSFIATIGTATVLGGLVEAYTGGNSIQNGISPSLTSLSSDNIFSIPWLFVLMAVVCLCAWYLLTQTVYGRHLSAAGTNQVAAALNGVSIKRTVFVSFVWSGALAGVAAVLQIGDQGVADATISGLLFIIQPLAAVFLGATAIRPGRFNVIGSILGLVFISSMVDGLVLLGLQPWVNDVFNGAAAVVAIAISAQIRRRRTGAVEIGS
jgi:ribose transport system permease protein